MGPLLMLLAICLSGSVLVPVLARWANATMVPSRAVVVTAGASLTAAFGAGISLSALALASVAGWSPIAREGHVSPSVLHALVPVPNWLGAVAAAMVAVLLARAVVRIAVTGAALCRSDRVCRSLPGHDPVVFIEGDDIVTLAGLRSRILVGTTLFDRLDPLDRKVVLAHERSHLRRRHHLYLHIVDLAAAANPLLDPARGIVRLGVERWADEDAAAADGVRDRDLAGKALARVALQRHRIHTMAPSRTTAAEATAALAAASLQVSTRVQALLDPPRPSRVSRILLLSGVSVIVLAAGIIGLAHTNNLIEAAQFHSPHP